MCNNNNNAAPLEPSGTREARPVPVQTPSSSFLQRNWTYTTADKTNLSFSPQRETQQEISRRSSSSEEEEKSLEAFASTPQKRAPSAQQQRPHAGRSRKVSTKKRVVRYNLQLRASLLSSKSIHAHSRSDFSKSIARSRRQCSFSLEPIQDGKHESHQN